MKRTLLLALFVLFANTAMAEKSHEIMLEKIKFSVPLKVVKPSDQLTFTNGDKIVHNIISMTNDFQFDLGVVKPGESKSVKFNETGVVDIQCTIHPEMKMTLFIFD